jgi:hypothetical protein
MIAAWLDLAAGIAEDLRHAKHKLTDREFATVMHLIALQDRFVGVGKDSAPTATKTFSAPTKPRKQIKRRLDPRPHTQMSVKEIEFDARMRRYLGRYKHWTAGEALDVLMSMGYRNGRSDFAASVAEFAAALRAVRRRFWQSPPNWTEVFYVAHKIGWQRVAGPVHEAVA